MERSLSHDLKRISSAFSDDKFIDIALKTAHTLSLEAVSVAGSSVVVHALRMPSGIMKGRRACERSTCAYKNAEGKRFCCKHCRDGSDGHGKKCARVAAGEIHDDPSC